MSDNLKEEIIQIGLDAKKGSKYSWKLIAKQIMDLADITGASYKNAFASFFEASGSRELFPFYKEVLDKLKENKECS